jgi:hypothetical protein
MRHFLTGAVMLVATMESQALTKGTVKDIRQLQSGLVSVTLAEDGKTVLVDPKATVTCNGNPAFFDFSRQYVSGLTASFTATGDKALSKIEFATVTPPASIAPPPNAAGIPGVQDGLDEVNAKRAARGLPPFIRDEGLSRGAARCASIKAANCHSGHLNGGMSDFACLDPGVHCRSTGADGSKCHLGDGWGWMTCCTFDNYQYAGAAWAIGPDGCRYMSLFVR